MCLPYLKFSDPLPETHLFLYLNLKNLNLCLLGKFFMPLLSSAEFFQNQIFGNILSGIPSECHLHSLDPDQAQCFVEPDLGPNCLQRLSAEDTSR